MERDEREDIGADAWRGIAAAEASRQPLRPKPLEFNLDIDVRPDTAPPTPREIYFGVDRKLDEAVRYSEPQKPINTSHASVDHEGRITYHPDNPAVGVLPGETTGRFKSGPPEPQYKRDRFLGEDPEFTDKIEELSMSLARQSMQHGAAMLTKSLYPDKDFTGWTDGDVLMWNAEEQRAAIFGKVKVSV